MDEIESEVDAAGFAKPQELGAVMGGGTVGGRALGTCELGTDAGGGGSELIREFDPMVNETVFFPRLVGGS